MEEKVVINVVNEPNIKYSAFAFGSEFANIGWCIGETKEETDENLKPMIGEVIESLDGYEYEIIGAELSDPSTNTITVTLSAQSPVWSAD